MQLGIFEFILILVGMLIVGLWGCIIIYGRYGLLDDKTDDKKKTKKPSVKEEKIKLSKEQKELIRENERKMKKIESERKHK